MTYGSGGGETAEEHMERLFETQTINGVSCNIRPTGGSYWGSPLNPGWFGIPDGNLKFRVQAAVISVDDFLAVQGVASEGARANFEEGAYGPTVERAKESIENGEADSIPTPVLELHYEDYRVKVQEGRSRALGAKLAGEEEIPIWVAARDYR